MKITEEMKEKINLLFKSGLTISGTAKQLGISTASVKKYLSDDNLRLLEKRKPKPIDDDMIVLINKVYAETLNMSEVARRLNISVNKVKTALTEDNQNLLSKETENFEALWFYVYRLFGEQTGKTPISMWNITQMKKFKSQGYTYRGQLLTLIYFYEVEHNSKEKSKGSIGIIPYVYERAAEYYNSIAERQKEIANQISMQLEKDRVEIKYDPTQYYSTKKKKQKINLDDIG